MKQVEDLIRTIKQSRERRGRPPLDFDAVEAAAVRFSNRLGEISLNKTLTYQGRAMARYGAGQALLAEVGKWYQPLSDGASKHSEQIRKRITERAELQYRLPSDPGLAVAAAMRRSEIRAVAASMDDLAVANLYRVGGPEVRFALDESLKIAVNKVGMAVVKPYVDEGVRLAVQIQAVDDAATPEERDLLDRLQEDGQSHASVAVAVQRAVERHAPKPPEAAPVPGLPKPDIKLLQEDGSWKPWPPPAA